MSLVSIVNVSSLGVGLHIGKAALPWACCVTGVCTPDLPIENNHIASPWQSWNEETPWEPPSIYTAAAQLLDNCR